MIQLIFNDFWSLRNDGIIESITYWSLCNDDVIESNNYWSLRNDSVFDDYVVIYPYVMMT